MQEIRRYTPLHNLTPIGNYTHIEGFNFKWFLREGMYSMVAQSTPLHDFLEKLWLTDDTLLVSPSNWHPRLRLHHYKGSCIEGKGVDYQAIQGLTHLILNQQVHYYPSSLTVGTRHPMIFTFSTFPPTPGIEDGIVYGCSQYVEIGPLKWEIDSQALRGEEYG